MPCYYPIRAYTSKLPLAHGKKAIAFSPRRGVDVGLEVPCGQCVGCRLERSRQWAVRLLHEAKQHDASWFVTLTYDDANLPYGNTLVKPHFQLFMKRLRNARSDQQIRFFHCGEYGDQLGRPHYHAILFGVDFPDKKRINFDDQKPEWTSPELEKLWGKGHVRFGAVTFESAAYVARYTVKKVTGKKAQAHYMSLNKETGEIIRRQPEYCTMSRRPGIGNSFISKYHPEVYLRDSVIVRGKENLPPKYYDKVTEYHSPQLIADTKARRKSRAETPQQQWNNSTRRLRIRETVAKAKLNLKRKIL